VTGSGPSRSRSLTAPFGVAVALHVAAVAVLVFAKAGEGKNMPPPVRIEMVAASAGAKAVGVVDPVKTAPDKPVPTRTKEAPKAPAPVKKTPPPKTKQTTASVPKPDTPQPKTAAAPKAGGGAAGGKGSDVVNLKVDDGIDFPFTGYLQNIVNQIMSRFEWKGNSTYRADVSFLIRRDGTIAEGSIRVVTTNGSYAFKAEATGAIEAAGNAKSFGKLPDEFADEVLPVVFSFDPKIIRQ
jgi:periplasmic protein TonB